MTTHRLDDRLMSVGGFAQQALHCSNVSTVRGLDVNHDHNRDGAIGCIERDCHAFTLHID